MALILPSHTWTRSADGQGAVATQDEPTVPEAHADGPMVERSAAPLQLIDRDWFRRYAIRELPFSSVRPSGD